MICNFRSQTNKQWNSPFRSPSFSEAIYNYYTAKKNQQKKKTAAATEHANGPLHSGQYIEREPDLWLSC